jgi:hypothetical protein
VDLGRDDNFFPGNHRQQGLTNDLLAATGRVDVGCVEKIDPGVQRLAEERL